MKREAIVCLLIPVLASATSLFAERSGSREERWERPADRAAAGIPGAGEITGPGDAYNLIVLGDGNDIASGSPGNDHIRGGPGEDQIQGLGGHDILEGGPDDDLLSGGEGNDQVRGQTGDDELYGFGGNDVLVGGPGRDLLYPGADDDRAYGGLGMDEGHYFVDENYFSNSDYYDGGPGYDLFNFRVPPEFSMAVANDIEMAFIMSPGYLDFSAWGIALVIENFEDLLIVWEPGFKGGGGQPLAAEETTWGGIKALYR
jgi:hypothetical protein